MIDENQNQGEETGVDYEAEAREQGWRPKEEFQGPEEKWVDAKTFYERGEHIFPLLKSSNKRLRQELLTRDQKIASLEAAIDASTKAIKALQKGYQENVLTQVEAAKKEVREQIKLARETGDVDTELELRERLDGLTEAQKAAKKEAEDAGKETTPPANAQNPALDPEFVKWNKENPWFGDTGTPENRKRSRQMIRIGEDLLDEGTSLKGRDFMDECLRILEEREAEGKGPQRRTTGKVEGASGTGARGNSATGFASLPKEAKDACHEAAEDVVGTKPGQYKTMKEWEDAYFKLYSEN